MLWVLKQCGKLLAAGEYPSDMAINAARDALKKGDVDPLDIDTIIRIKKLKGRNQNMKLSPPSQSMAFA